MSVYKELPLEESFPRKYEIEWLVDMPSSTSMKRFEFGTGPILRIKPATGDKFLAIVPGEVSDLKLSTWPDPDAFFVQPSGWLINSRNPEASTKLPEFVGHTSHYVFPIPSKGLVIVGHCCGMYCYGANGLRWQQDDLFCCEDPILDVAGDTLLVVAHKHAEDPRETPMRKILDLTTGARLG